MRFSFAISAILSASLASAEDRTVTVGEGGALTFNPTSVQAAEGDTITFSFRGGNHSVTQSTFADPCTVMTTPKAGVDSGFQMVEAGADMLPQWSITVDNSSAPLWFFCAQTIPANHCQKGMVFAINPTADKTFDAFLSAATGGAAAAASASASGVGGGADASGAGAEGAASGGGASKTADGSTGSAGSASASGVAPSSTDNGASPHDAQAAVLSITALLLGLIL